MTDLEAEAVLTLVTGPDRLDPDMIAFAAVASSMRTCTATHEGSDGATFTIGTGAPCPETAVWF